MRKIILLIFIFILQNHHAQKTVTVPIKFELSDNISFQDGIKLALKEAKEEALRKAGISENITSYSLLSSSSINDDLTEIFNDDILLDIQGAIDSWEYTKKPEKYLDKEINANYIKLEIKAKVKKYKSKADAQFVARIEGIKGSYNNEERINIIITPSKDCFLKLFYMNGNEASIVYPIKTPEIEKELELFKDKLLLKNQIKTIDYLTAETKNKIETGRFIVVITKQPYDFTESELDDDGYYTKTEVEKIFQWIMKIEPENRNVYFEQISIHK